VALLNLGGTVMKGNDDKALNSLDSTQNYDHTGGLVELNWTGLINNRFVATAMYNWVLPPSYDSDRQINAYSAILRYYLGDCLLTIRFFRTISVTARRFLGGLWSLTPAVSSITRRLPEHVRAASLRLCEV
jgi:hypothetical protein